MLVNIVGIAFLKNCIYRFFRLYHSMGLWNLGTLTVHEQCPTLGSLHTGHIKVNVYFQAPYVMKLLYTLTKPSDVARKRVLGLIDLAKKRDGKKVCSIR